MAATTKKSFQLIFSGQVGLSVKQVAAYFLWLNIDLFTRKLIIIAIRQNAAFGTQNLRRVSKLRVTKWNNLDQKNYQILKYNIKTYVDSN